MINNQEDDEFIAVRVQDPRIQNDGSWNSYVDYKIFLHTNSKAFTAKTSCVRRRYSEFFWLKKKLQKNAGLVPVPALPRKSIFYFSNEDFLEGRRKGLQAFLDKVVHMTVCLSDSQLHLFLQTQLPVGHIQDCVQGHTPYTVTDAILTYASSNQGFAQAQEEDTIKEPSLTISYESMESPAPHQPCLQVKEIFRPDLLSCSDSEPLGTPENHCDQGTEELQQKEKIQVLQTSDHLEAVVDDCNTAEVSFYLGDGQDDSGSLSPAELPHQRTETPVEVHNPIAAGPEINDEVNSASDGLCSPRQESVGTDTDKNTDAHPDTEEDAEVENKSETEKCVDSAVILDPVKSDTRSQEDVLEDMCSEMQVLENHVIADDDDDEGFPCVSGSDGQDADVICPEEIVNSDRQVEPDEVTPELEINVETPSESEIMEEVDDTPQVEIGDDDSVQPTDQRQISQELGLVVMKNETDEDSYSLPSSNESIVKVSDDESICDEASDLIQTENDYMNTSCVEVALWSEVETSSTNILDLKGSLAEKHDISTQEDGEDLQYISEINNLCTSLDVNLGVSVGDLTENGDFKILATSDSFGLADDNCID
ncbi:sorting nexin-11 [Antennarius striatus]|uniref:sorting nexin-11 n=1 Tax=Antennarius striatus TaxID=241820 RepID=UPI0035B0E986